MILNYRSKIVALFIAAFLIRLISLNQSLWLDEATTAMTIQTFSFTQIISQFSPSDFHPPLYYLAMKLWTSLFGYSEIALRFPSILFTLGAGWYVYKIGKIISGFPIPDALIGKSGVRDDKGNGSFAYSQDDNKAIAFWSAAFFLFNPLIIYYSQEARMYALATFTVAASFYYVLCVAKERNNYKGVKSQKSKIKNFFDGLNKDFWLMNFFLILSFYTFYASVFYITAVYLFMFMSSSGLTQRSRILLWIPACAGITRKIFIFSLLIFFFSLLIIFPLLYHQFVSSRQVLALVPNWSQVLGNISFKNLFLIPIKFTSGRISFYPKMVYYLFAGFWMAVIGIIASVGAIYKPRATWGILLYFFGTPILLGIVFSFVSPLLQYFRFQYLIVFVSLILGYSVTLIPRLSLPWSPSHPTMRKMDLPSRSKWISAVTLTQFIIISGFLTWSFTYLLNPQFHREDWKSLVQNLQQEKAPIYMILSSSDPLKYYAPNIDVRSLKTLDPQNLEREIIVIPYTADIHGINYEKNLTSQKFNRIATTSVRALQYEKWKQK